MCDDLKQEARDRCAYCVLTGLLGRDASGDQLVSLPTVVAEQQQAQISIDSSFTFVAKEGQTTATITVTGIQNARVNLEIKPIEGQGNATFDDGSKMKTNVVVPAGNQLPVTIKGVKESSTKENLNLIATLASDTSTKDERKFSVVAVKKVEWLDKNGNALEDNNHPDFKIGKRVFPDATASGGKPQNTVKVRAIITPDVEGVEVYFRSLDVDDPASDSDIDDEQGDKDNFGGEPKEGVFPDKKPKKTARDRDGQMAAITDFQVTMQPGDNFRVVATCVSQKALDSVTAPKKVSDGRVVDANNKVITDDDTPTTIKASPVLTVWRKLHVEVDSMEAAPAINNPASATHPERNFIQGNIVRIEGSGNDARKLTLTPDATNPTVQLRDRSPDLDGVLNPTGNQVGKGNGRFERGAILVGRAAGAVIILGLDGNGVDYVKKDAGMTIPFQLVDQTGGNPLPETPRRVSITKMDPDKKEFHLSESVKKGDHAGGTLTVAGVNFKVVKAAGPNITVEEETKLPFVLIDDDVETAPFLQRPPMEEDAQGGTPFELMQRSDSAERNLYARAYVKPVYDLASGTAPFNRNIEPGLEVSMISKSQDFKSDDNFWVIYMQGALQGTTIRDADPDSEANPGIGVVTGDTAAAVGSDGSLSLIGGSTIYVETLRDVERIKRVTDNLCFKITTAHESGHQFGFKENSGGIMNHGCPNPSPQFTTKQLKAIRQRSHPQG